jgi:molybdate transport system substrate-binding protein
VKRFALGLLLVVFALAGCGGDDGGSSGSGSGAPSGDLTVSAAASLKEAFTEYSGSFAEQAKMHVSFAGSDALAAQIRKGIRPDVFAAANTKLPDALYSEGLVEKPVVFAGNRLVIAVPPDTEIKSVEDLAKPGTKIAIGSEGVPVGDYTRTLLGKLDPATRDAIMKNVRSEEPDVKGVVGKVSQGAVDAGFVYVTDVVAARGDLAHVDLPAELDPSVSYGIAIVKGGKNPDAAKKFVDGLLSGEGAKIMHDAGFTPPR